MNGLHVTGEQPQQVNDAGMDFVSPTHRVMQQQTILTVCLKIQCRRNIVTRG